MKTRVAEVETTGHRHIIVVRGSVSAYKFNLTIMARIRKTSPDIPIEALAIIVDALYVHLK